MEQRCYPEPLVDAITRFLTHVQVPDIPAMRASVERVVDDAGAAALETLRQHLDGDRRLLMHCFGYAVAALIPSRYRGIYGERPSVHEAARLLSEELFPN